MYDSSGSLLDCAALIGQLTKSPTKMPTRASEGIFISINYTIDAESEELQLPNNQKIESFIKEMVFIIKEHSGYALAHPGDLDNSIRHLEHTCHLMQ